LGTWKWLERNSYGWLRGHDGLASRAWQRLELLLELDLEGILDASLAEMVVLEKNFCVGLGDMHDAGAASGAASGRHSRSGFEQMEVAGKEFLKLAPKA
jgi:hypothetical protein